MHTGQRINAVSTGRPMQYIVVSAATAGSRYVACLDKQSARLGDRFYGVQLPPAQSWEEGTKVKPTAVREAFKVSPVVLWVDADCTLSPPDTLPVGNWDIGTTYNYHPTHKLKISAGFILLRDTANTRRFLDVWDVLNGRHCKDHPALVQAIRQCKSRLKVADITGWLRGRCIINDLSPDRGRHVV